MPQMIYTACFAFMVMLAWHVWTKEGIASQLDAAQFQIDQLLKRVEKLEAWKKEIQK